MNSVENDPSAIDPLQPLSLSHDIGKITYTSSLLTSDELELLESVFQWNKDVFAWTHSDMSGIHPSMASHRLNVMPSSHPVRQKVRRFHPDRQKIIQAEIDKLLVVRFIREVKYLDWLANVVVIQKNDGKCRVCVDYTNLNDSCPKDIFSLPWIDQIVDATTEHGMLSFIDAFSGYHQIPMF